MPFQSTFQEADTSFSSATSADEAEMTKNEPTSRLSVSEQEEDLRRLGGDEFAAQSSSCSTEEGETSFRWPSRKNLVAGKDAIKEIDSLLRAAIWEKAKSQQSMADKDMFSSPKTTFEPPEEVGFVTRETPKIVGWMIWEFSSARARNMWLEEMHNIISIHQCNSGLIHVFIKSHLFNGLGSNPAERGKELIDMIQYFDKDLVASEAKFEEAFQVNEESTMVSIRCSNCWIERIAKNAHLLTTIENIVFYTQVKV